MNDDPRKDGNGTAEAPLPRPRPRGPFVLIVDGDLRRSRTLARSLEAEGCYGAAASSGADALDFVARHRPDVVICGRALSDMSGLDLARRIRANHARTRVVVERSAADRANDGDGLLHVPALAAPHLRRLIGAPRESQGRPRGV